MWEVFMESVREKGMWRERGNGRKLEVSLRVDDANGTEDGP